MNDADVKLHPKPSFANRTVAAPPSHAMQRAPLVGTNDSHDEIKAKDQLNPLLNLFQHPMQWMLDFHSAYSWASSAASIQASGNAV